MTHRPDPDYRGACSACRHSAQGEADATNIGAPRPLLCRAHPPMPMMLSTPQGVVTGAAWPNVLPGQWCGEFEP